MPHGKDTVYSFLGKATKKQTKTSWQFEFYTGEAIFAGDEVQIRSDGRLVRRFDHERPAIGYATRNIDQGVIALYDEETCRVYRTD